MQVTKTFGRRGVTAAPAFPVFPPFEATVAPAMDAVETKPRRIVVPWVTFGILAMLLAIYLLEAGVSAAGGHPGRISHGALVKLGGLSRSMALGAGQPWRLLTASLLHLSVPHLMGNAVALLLVGLLLEPIVGRAWFALIYVVGGLGGAAGSLALNPPQLVSAGASGAIMCLLACSLVLSLHAASHEKSRRMQVLSLRVMIPALLPLSGSHGHVDYSAHIGGVVTGMVLGFLLQILWREAQPRPPGQAAVGWIAAVVAGAGLLAVGFAAALPSSAPAATPGLIPVDDMPTTLPQGIAQGAKLAALYPDDPRGHVLKAIGFMKARDDADAEAEYLQALQSPLLKAPELQPNFFLAIRGGLSAVYLREGRADAARATAAPLCAAPSLVEPRLMSLIRRAKLCDPA